MENARKAVRNVEDDIESQYGYIFSVSGPGTLFPFCCLFF